MTGKGRGIAAFTFNIEALGHNFCALLQQIEYKTGPLKAGENEAYMRDKEELLNKLDVGTHWSSPIGK
uniref:Uncharacterized protein n=1 Tax=Cyprinus carpio TaxID=7962 RepID=A0A8C1WKQ2_CYPCA